MKTRKEELNQTRHRSC